MDAWGAEAGSLAADPDGPGFGAAQVRLYVGRQECYFTSRWLRMRCLCAMFAMFV